MKPTEEAQRRLKPQSQGVPGRNVAGRPPATRARNDGSASW